MLERRRAVGTAVALVALCSPAGALAAAQERTPNDRLAVQATALRAKLERLSKDRSRLKQQLRKERKRRTRLLSKLATRTRQRDALQARLDAMPSQLQRAVEQVRRDVAYSELALQRASKPYSRNALIAHATMSYVVGHVSAPGYGYMNEILNTRPIPTAEGVLEAGSGICGHAALTFAAIVKRFGLPVRSVQFYYGANNHIANEVFYDGDWHYFDPTYGAFYGSVVDVLSIAEARTSPSPGLHQSSTLFWWSVGVMSGHTGALDFATDPATRVEIDKQPFR